MVDKVVYFENNAVVLVFLLADFQISLGPFLLVVPCDDVHFGEAIVGFLLEGLGRRSVSVLVLLYP